MNWLFLRGLARDHRHWDSFPAVFESVTHGKVHFLDLPGVGLSKSLSAPVTVNAMTEILRRQWLELKASHSGPWMVLGISLGGMTVLDWVSKHNDFEKAVVINSSSRDVGKPWDRLKVDILPFFGAALFYRDPFKQEQNILKMTTNLLNVDEQAKKWAKLHKEGPVINVKNAAKQMAAAATFQSPKSILTPLLFLAATEDQMVNHHCSERLALKYKAPILFHDKAGHDLPLDAPQWTSESVNTWISSQ